MFDKGYIILLNSEWRPTASYVLYIYFIICVMNRLLYILLLAIVFFSCKEKKADNDWGKMNLHGKVKMIKETDYFLDTTGDNKGKKLRWTHVYVFDKAGLLVTESQTDEKGVFQFKESYSYDSNKKMIAHAHFYDASRPSVITNYTYNKAGQKISEQRLALSWGITNRYDTDYTVYYEYRDSNIVCGKKIWKQDYLALERRRAMYFPDTEVFIMKYDDHQRLLTANTTDRDGFRQRVSYNYDERGNCVLMMADTALPNKELKTQRAFDESDNVVKEESYEVGNILHSQKNMEYLKPDKQGNWTEQRIHWHDLGTTVLERVIEYYP